MDQNLQNITAPGNPELFQKRFNSTWNFLQAVAQSARNPKLVYEESFQSHIKKFNLPVYFEICFQQIAGHLENEIVHSQNIEDVLIENDTLSLNFKLKLFSTFWKCMSDCFHPDIYLAPLSNQFIKLSMLLLSRLLRFVDELGVESKGNPLLQKYLVYCLVDIISLEHLIGAHIKDNVQESIYKIMLQVLWPIVSTQITNHNERLLNRTIEKMKTYLIDLQVEQCVEILQQVTSIPRLYRRTNKALSNQPSNYMVEAVNILEKFNEKNTEVLRGIIISFMQSCVQNITNQ